MLLHNSPCCSFWCHKPRHSERNFFYCGTLSAGHNHSNCGVLLVFILFIIFREQLFVRKDIYEIIFPFFSPLSLLLFSWLDFTEYAERIMHKKKSTLGTILISKLTEILNVISLNSSYVAEWWENYSKKRTKEKSITGHESSPQMCFFNSFMIFFYTFFIFIIHETRESIMQYLTNVLNLTREKHNLLKCHESKAISQFYKHLWIFVCLLHAMNCCFCVCFSKGTAHNTCPLNHQIWFAANFPPWFSVFTIASNVDFNNL